MFCGLGGFLISIVSSSLDKEHLVLSTNIGLIEPLNWIVMIAMSCIGKNYEPSKSRIQEGNLILIPNNKQFLWFGMVDQKLQFEYQLTHQKSKYPLSMNCKSGLWLSNLINSSTYPFKKIVLILSYSYLPPTSRSTCRDNSSVPTEHLNFNGGTRHGELHPRLGHCRLLHPPGPGLQRHSKPTGCCWIKLGHHGSVYVESGKFSYTKISREN